jgi:hypothetical protein
VLKLYETKEYKQMIKAKGGKSQEEWNFQLKLKGQNKEETKESADDQTFYDSPNFG